MTKAEEQLRAIGFGGNRSEPACWRAVRLDRPNLSARPRQARLEPGCSRARLRWRELLAGNPRPSPYRISPVAG
jgi:hypothetical protein